MKVKERRQRRVYLGFTLHKQIQRVLHCVAPQAEFVGCSFYLILVIFCRLPPNEACPLFLLLNRWTVRFPMRTFLEKTLRCIDFWGDLAPLGNKVIFIHIFLSLEARLKTIAASVTWTRTSMTLKYVGFLCSRTPGNLMRFQSRFPSRRWPWKLPTLAARSLDLTYQRCK